MEKRTIIKLLSILLIVSCSKVEESEKTVIEDQSFPTRSPIAKLIATEDGKRGLNNLLSSRLSNKNQGNGVILIKNGADYVACGNDENYFVCVYGIEDEFYKSPIDLMILHNGLAQFKANSKDFAIEVWELPSFNLLYSNLCMDEYEGNLHINLLATFKLVTDDPFVDFEYYTYDEPASANNMQITARVNDATRNLDIDELTWDCVDPTTEKKVKVTSLDKKNGSYYFKVHGL